ncbi:hypothetical protein [Dactylosporangium sp. CA-233914]|uniref:hypothetical protein n=1 Tax=Dactylosporangium sp. CA-233914 TaxID=3239934 RepID=UPI003D8AFC7F
MTAAKPGKAAQSSWAAKVLGIDYGDLPNLGRPWTKGDVRALRDSKPEWLTEARRRHSVRKQEAAEARTAELVAAFERLGYDAPDLGTLDQALLYIDGARIHLMSETRCSEGEADRAAWRRWPRSMAAEEHDADRGNFW